MKNTLKWKPLALTPLNVVAVEPRIKLYLLGTQITFGTNVHNVLEANIQSVYVICFEMYLTKTTDSFLQMVRDSKLI